MSNGRIEYNNNNIIKKSTKIILFDKKFNKVSETETVHDDCMETITKVHATSLSKDEKINTR